MKNLRDCVYSLDMLRVDFELKKGDLQYFYNRIANDVRITHWETGSFKSYKHNIRVACDDNQSFWIGTEPNWVMKEEEFKLVTVEFNPSKVGHDLNFWSLYGMILNNSVSGARVRRFDVAIDIPVPRSKCYLLKDNRLYEERKRSLEGEFTQYLGQRNSHGRVKLYNKALELGLDTNDLTRLEVTCDFEERSSIVDLIPTIYTLEDYQMGIGVTGTDKVLLIACLQDMSLLNELSRKKKEKIKELIAVNSLKFEFDKNKYNNILTDIYKYTSLE